MFCWKGKGGVEEIACFRFVLSRPRTVRRLALMEYIYFSFLLELFLFTLHALSLFLKVLVHVASARLKVFELQEYGVGLAVP